MDAIALGELRLSLRFCLLVSVLAVATAVPARAADENTDASCSDGIDNDDDGFTDCDDFGCSQNPLVTVCPEPAANALVMAEMLVLGALARRSRSVPSPVEIARAQ
jgi:hypothetical protein